MGAGYAGGTCEAAGSVTVRTGGGKGAGGNGVTNEITGSGMGANGGDLDGPGVVAIERAFLDVVPSKLVWGIVIQCPLEHMGVERHS